MASSLRDVTSLRCQCPSPASVHDADVETCYMIFFFSPITDFALRASLDISQCLHLPYWTKMKPRPRSSQRTVDTRTHLSSYVCLQYPLYSKSLANFWDTSDIQRPHWLHYSLRDKLAWIWVNRGCPLSEEGGMDFAGAQSVHLRGGVKKSRYTESVQWLSVSWSPREQTTAKWPISSERMPTKTARLSSLLVNLFRAEVNTRGVRMMMMMKLDRPHTHTSPRSVHWLITNY